MDDNSFNRGAVGAHPMRNRYGPVRETFGREYTGPSRLQFSFCDSQSVSTETTGTHGASSASENASETVRVFVRIRPLIGQEQGTFETTEGQKTIVTVQYPRTIVFRQPVEKGPYFVPGTVVSSAKEHRLTFTGVMGPEFDQAAVYGQVMGEQLRCIDVGSNSVLFSFGTTNAGKTYTMRGSSSDPGMVRRALVQIFQCMDGRLAPDLPVSPTYFNQVAVVSTDDMRERAHQKQRLLKLGRMDVNASQVAQVLEALTHEGSNERFDNERASVLTIAGNGRVAQYDHFTVFVSYLEIYNGNCLDLFEIPPSSSKARTFLKVREYKGVSDVVYVEGLSEIPVDNLEDALTLMQAGMNNLHYAATNLNHQSSRSHCVFTVKIVGVNDLVNPTLGMAAVTSFCDLAGSERADKAQTKGERFQESRKINCSISALMNCVKRMKERDAKAAKGKAPKVVIPFRESKLTHVLKNFFMNGKVTMIVNIAMCNDLLPETLTVLRFSSDAAKVALANYTAPKLIMRQERPDVERNPLREQNQEEENRFITRFKRISECVKVRRTFFKAPSSTVAEEEEDYGEAEAAGDVAAGGGVVVTTVDLASAAEDEAVDENEQGAVPVTCSATVTKSAAPTYRDTYSSVAGRETPEPLAGGPPGAGASNFMTPIDESMDLEDADAHLKYWKDMAAYYQKASDLYRGKYLEYKGKCQSVKRATREELEEKYQKAMDDFSQKIREAYWEGKEAARNEYEAAQDDEKDDEEERDERNKIDVEHFRKETDELRKNLDEATAVIVRLEEENASLKEELGVVRNALCNDDALKKSLEAKDKKIDELEKTFADACETYEEQNRIISAANAEKVRLQDELTNAMEKISDLEVELESVREGNSEVVKGLESQIDDMKKEVEVLTKQLSDVKSLRAELEAMKRERAEAVNLQGIIDNLETEVGKLKAYKKLYEDEKAKNAACSAVEAEKQDLITQRACLQDKVIALSADLQQKTLSSCSYEKEVAVLRQQEKALNAEVATLRAQIEKYKILEREHEAIKSARKQDRQRRDEEVMKMQQLERSNEEAEKEALQLRVNVKETLAAKIEVENRLKESQAENEGIRAKLAAAEAQIAALNARRDVTPPPSRDVLSSSTRKAASSRRKIKPVVETPEPLATIDNEPPCSARTKQAPKDAACDDFVRPKALKRSTRKAALDDASQDSVSESESEGGTKRARKQLGARKRKVLDESATDSPGVTLDYTPASSAGEELRRAIAAVNPAPATRGRGRPRRR